MLNFKEFIKLSENRENNDISSVSTARYTAKKLKNKKIPKNTAPESMSVIIPEPQLDTGGNEKNLIIFDA
jgi:hypothetical protein